MTNPAVFALASLRPSLVGCFAAFTLSFSLPAARGAGDGDDKPKPNPKPEVAEKAKSEDQAKAKANPAAKQKGADEKADPAPASKADKNLEVRVFEVAADFFRISADSTPGPSDPFAPDTGSDASLGVVTPQKSLERLGITFGPGASAVYHPASLQLTVRNTAEQLDLIEAYVAHVDSQRERQITIIVEMIEVEHADFSDWLFDNRIDTDGTDLRKWAQEKINDGDAVIIESAVVLARSGQRAKVESIHEFIYPTDFDPAEIPNEVELHDKAKAPVTAASPTAYETRNLGTTFEVDPVIGRDNSTIDLNLAPEMVELEGYTIWPHEDIDPLFKVRMPTFYAMRITTQVTVIDGHYVFLGTVRPLEGSVKGIEDPMVLAFVRADIGVTPLAKPRKVAVQPEESK